MRTAFARKPPRGSPLGLRSWAREMHALAAVMRAPLPDVAALPRGDGHTVLVIPGFLTGDWATARLRTSLARLGYAVARPRIDVNLGPTPSLVGKLDATLTALTRDGGRISLVGLSLGGVLARELAKRHPARVRQVVTLCSPIRMPVTTNLHVFVAACAPRFDRVLSADPASVLTPPPVPVTAVISPLDGIVDWRDCVPDPAPHVRVVEVAGPHTTMGSYGPALAVVAEALAVPDCAAIQARNGA